MKTILFITLSTLYLTSILTSCTPINPQPNPNPNTTSANSNWKFKLTINGNTYRAEGSGYNINSNYCIAPGSAGSYNVAFFINDLTAPSFISGSQGSALMTLQYPVVGANPITSCAISSVPWIINYLPASALAFGYSLSLNGSLVPNSIGASHLRLPLTITDLGSPGNNDYISFGNPLKGNYTGTVYVKSNPTSAFDTPVSIVLDFVALRP
jgi:hypothetical protein